jgi:chorismate-pyruvate lyase
MNAPKPAANTVGQRPNRRAAVRQIDPIDALFLQPDHRPDWVRPVDPALLGPVARIALTLDGTLTTLLAVVANEEILSEPAPEPEGDAAALAGMLDIAADEPMTYRETQLKGADSGNAYIAARSVLAPSRFPAGFAEALPQSSAGIGQALADCQAETRRELLWWGEQDGVLVRTYRIIHQGKPLAVIEETFLPDFESLANAP